MTKEEWLRYFASIGCDYGMMWHLMAGLYDLGQVKELN